MKKTMIITAVILALLLSFGCSSKKESKTDDNQPQAVKVQSDSNSAKPSGLRPAPDFTLKLISGESIKISDYKGKVIFLDFWATWCPPCRAEIPFFVELYEQYNKDGLVIIGAALDDEAKVKAFAPQFKINYPVGEVDRSVASLYGGVRGIPTTFIINRQGEIVKSYTGFRPKAVFEEDFLALK